MAVRGDKFKARSKNEMIFQSMDGYRMSLQKLDGVSLNERRRSQLGRPEEESKSEETGRDPRFRQKMQGSRRESSDYVPQPIILLNQFQNVVIGIGNLSSHRRYDSSELDKI